ncbi:hypothetical protein DSM104443_00745 [Usitatibacter rugosus]|uniref:NodB homology domain-containing protein n=1 Tax=Usitatibacter rugosus TaxID=2732067 RepID=A0A6M4GRK7_9PROT|nr:polysaccharide deacetylase family protein [Usitatibacter rugosus]QJR09695.1 hypothetical protein DSM104443_00745 [Usitatibacter rugosus]
MFSRLTGFVAALLLATTAHAILVRPDREDGEYLELATRYESAVALPVGEGALIAPRWILTSANVARALDAQQPRARPVIAGKPREIVEVRIQADLALLQLREPVEELEPTPIHREADEGGKTVRIVGHGSTGRVGDKGVKANPARQGRAAINTVDRVGLRTFAVRLKPADDASDLQGAFAADERGAAAFFETKEGGIFVAGIATLTDDANNDGIAGNIGDWQIFARVSAYAAWIDAATGEGKPAVQAKTIAFSFDDGFDPRTQPEAGVWNTRMLRALEAAGIKAALFPAGRFVDSPDGLALVRAWGEAGHSIGNHTYSHTDFDTLPLEACIADIARGDGLLKAMPRFKPWLRFPYLREGATAGKRDGIRDWLAKNSYASAPISVMTGDGYYSQRLEAALRARADRDNDPFRRAYVRHLVERAAYSDRLARDTLGRSPAHVMLLHTNLANAMFLPDVIAALRAGGWTLVDAETAFADPLYRTQPKGLPAGSNIVVELAKDAGRTVPPGPEDDYGKATLEALGY